MSHRNPPHRSKTDSLADLIVFCLLVAIGVAGRLGAPVWHFTPIAAVGLFAGAYFSNRALAVAVPLVAMLLSNLWLPAYHNGPVMAVVYVMLAAPALAGPWLRRRRVKSTGAWVARLAAGSFVPSLAFFLTTNLAEWAFTSNYDKTLAGLAHCFTSAVPFYRQMLAGDACYVALLFGAAALAGVASPAVQPKAALQEVPRR